MEKWILSGLGLVVAAAFAIAGDITCLVDLESIPPHARELSPNLVSCYQDGSNLVISAQISHWPNLIRIEKQTWVTNAVCKVGFALVYESMGKGIKQTNNVSWFLPGRRISDFVKVQVLDCGEFNMKIDRFKER